MDQNATMPQAYTWANIQAKLAAGKNGMQIFPTAAALQDSGRSFPSYMEAVLASVSCMMVKNIVRVLGSGEDESQSASAFSQHWGPSFGENTLIAHDVFGGLFALHGTVWYFAPEKLAWEDLGITYETFIDFLADGDLDKFYYSFVWAGAEQTFAQIATNQALLVYPPLYAIDHANGGLRTQEAQKQIVMLDELLGLNLEIMQQLNAGE